MRRLRHLAVPALFAVVFVATMNTRAPLSAAGAGQVPAERGQVPAALGTDADVYAFACANCHGLDGRGRADVSALLDLPLPDFADCNFATREPDADWGAVVHQGGPVRGFGPEMPAFGDALSFEQIDAALRHVRTFCPEPAWPPGELNLPRAMYTEKAYPEDEAVWTTDVAVSGDGAIANEIVYERRFGARNQYEVKLPLDFAESAAGDWRFGAGDIGVGFKRALAHDAARGYILSAAAEIVLPTGDESASAGKGTMVFEPFVSYGQILAADSFIQAQAGLEMPFDTDKAENEGFIRFVAGRTWATGPNGFGRTWTPMVELLGARAFEDGERTHWDVVPQVQVSLNTRQHILLNAGLRIPMNEREGRSTRFAVYLLWDWFDGGLFDGW